MTSIPSTHELPSTRHLLTSLINSLATSTNTSEAAPSNPVSPPNKPILLTLHALFPKELLPALDLLDRGLVTRIHINPPTTNRDTPPTSSPHTTPHSRSPLAFYTVRTAQPPRSKHATAVAPTTYIVHLHAWSCSCPAFAFAAFPAESPSVDDEDFVVETSQEWRFGGLTRGDELAVCKHLLACVLAECGGSGRMVEETGVELEEAAGWAAGWGD